jgi:hypothetical protein
METSQHMKEYIEIKFNVGNRCNSKITYKTQCKFTIKINILAQASFIKPNEMQAFEKSKFISFDDYIFQKIKIIQKEIVHRYIIVYNWN